MLEFTLSDKIRYYVSSMTVLRILTLLFLARVGRTVPIRVMYGGRGNGLWPLPGIMSSVPAASSPQVLSSSAGTQRRKKKKKNLRYTISFISAGN